VLLPRLPAPAEDVFPYVQRLNVEFLPRNHIESSGVRDWIPESSVERETLFPILRDACGGAGRVRAVFTASRLASWLFDFHKIKIFGAPGDSLENYLRSIDAQFDAIAVPGTSLNSKRSDLFIWPNIVAISREHHTDFEEEAPLLWRPRAETTVELNSFPANPPSCVLLDAISHQDFAIDTEIYWAVFEKGHNLPTGRALECIWSAQGVTCCDRLKKAFAERPEKRGEILDLLEKIAPLEGLSIKVIGNQLHLEKR
jgi:hypothetical protein